MHTPQPASPKNVRVLVVDDSEDATEMLSLMLEHKGYENARAHSGSEALQAFEAFHPDVVLLDIGLPDVDGYSVATEMRKLDPETLLIAVTGFGDDRTLDAVRNCGFARHLLKPINWQALDEVLVKAANRPRA